MRASYHRATYTRNCRRHLRSALLSSFTGCGSTHWLPEEEVYAQVARSMPVRYSCRRYKRVWQNVRDGVGEQQRRVLESVRCPELASKGNRKVLGKQDVSRQSAEVCEQHERPVIEPRGCIESITSITEPPNPHPPPHTATRTPPTHPLSIANTDVTIDAIP